MNLLKDKIVGEILSRLSERRPENGPLKVDGTWGSFAPMLAAYISDQLKRPILYVTAHLDDADSAFDDLEIFSETGVEFFPVWETREKYADATDEIGAQRLRISMALSQAAEADTAGLIIVTGVQALNQPVPKPAALRDRRLSLRTSQTIEPQLVVTWLVDNGFERVDAVDLPGQFAQRGGIIDIFAPVTGRDVLSLGGKNFQIAQPIRVEFFGDSIESIRTIDLDSQRSLEKIENAFLVPTSSHENLTETENLINLLPKNTIIIFEEPVEIADVSQTFLSRVDDPRGLYPWEAIYKAMGEFTQLEICRFGGGEGSIALKVTSAQQFEYKGGEIWKSNRAAIEELIKQTQEPLNKEVLLFCENTAEIKRVTEIIEDIASSVPEKLKLQLGFIRQGFIVDSLDTIVVSHHEIFGQHATRRRIRKIRSTTPVESLIDLQKGDYVVHISYGIGKFIGIETITRDEYKSEYLTIEYASKSIIHVPVHKIHLIQKYIGSLPKRPKLSVLGSKKWENQKKKAAEGVQELAEELLEIQAKRQSLGGFAFGEDTIWQKEFEESFLYQETADQISTIEQFKKDMMEPKPMDRLICGDVGYGKTEVAMRAAFKAIESGKQVAILVPTTVLCVQHGRTFKERFADFPINIEILNRFITTKRAKEVTALAKQGKVDILIGTHRLLSKDVGFRDLGLLIIDEEQRFGVAHKERLKKFRVNVDVLTMTATPIPRTLHLSLLGLRDISALATPPLDRRSIVTKVCRFDKDTIRKAIIRELNRQGQVFFLHNRVQSIDRMAGEVAKIVNDPTVRIAVAHGQMPKTQLEKAMLDFVCGKTDILVCSTIIESGLDIPNANTMIINDADRFGLAQLHQLRGRVGRYKHRAYAYMLLPVTRSITPVAAKRLKAIEEYSQLGAGFRIALRDLEIRGAGNILGAEQSGHINTVGYEMFCRLLSDAVKRLKNEPVERPASAIINLGFSTYIPKSYIPSDRQRMDVYRRIALTKETSDLELMREELTDLFGPVPEQVTMFLDLTEIRVRASKHAIKSIVAQDNDLIFSFETEDQAADIFARAPGKVRIPDKTTVLINLKKNYFQPRTLMAMLRKMLTL